VQAKIVARLLQRISQGDLVFPSACHPSLDPFVAFCENARWRVESSTMAESLVARTALLVGG